MHPWLEEKQNYRRAADAHLLTEVSKVLDSVYYFLRTLVGEVEPGVAQKLAQHLSDIESQRKRIDERDREWTSIRTMSDYVTREYRVALVRVLDDSYDLLFDADDVRIWFWGRELVEVHKITYARNVTAEAVRGLNIKLTLEELREAQGSREA